MKILLIGKTGQLGSAILSQPNGHDVVAPTRLELDIEDSSSINFYLDSERPDVVINTSAFHNLPACELEPLRAFAVNCVAVRNLACACRDRNTKLVTFSTDYVFGGEERAPYTEKDPTKPLQMYGISRVAGESAALAVAPEHTVIIRTCGLYGLSGATSKGGNFVDKRITDALKTDYLEMGNDQVVSPTYTEDLARAVAQLIEHKEVTGIFHLTNEGECTWFEFTKTIFNIMGFETELKGVDRKGLSGDMRRPLYSVLANNNARKLGITMPHWKNALIRYLKKKY